MIKSFQLVILIQLYTYNLSIDWGYKLDTLELIISNQDIFKQCQAISRLVNYNIIDKYTLFSENEINIAKWIAKIFIKAKSHLERLFFVNLHNEIRDAMESKSFYFSQYANDENKAIFITIQKDVSGLYVFVEQYNNNDNTVNSEVTYIYDSIKDIFHPQKIEKLFNDNYLSKKVEECSLKIIPFNNL